MPLPDIQDIGERVRDHVSGHIASVLPGQETILSQPVDPERNKVWLLDSTAYWEPQYGWKAEVVACAFAAQGRKKTDESIAKIADFVGLDGKMSMNDDQATTRDRIEERLGPFLDPVSPGRLVRIDIPTSEQTYNFVVGPGDPSGVATQTLTLPPVPEVRHGGGQVLRPRLHDWPPSSSPTMDLRFEGPDGWLVISDIDDTIKRTMTPDPTGIVRTTFVEHAQPIPLMPQLYAHVDRQVANPTWFFLSASPYNLYPFLRRFLHGHYPRGTVILRTASVSDPTGLVETVTQNTYEFKTSQIIKIHQWFPRRKVLCVGDSTQKDPETYAEMYRKFPGWIRAIFIRKVTDAPHMTDKNKQKRFDDAFHGIPPNVYAVFESPNELQHLVSGLRFRG